MGKGNLAMKKLVLRLLALVLSVYLVGSIYPLFATEWGHSHGPAPSGPPPPPPPPAPTTPSAPPMLDTKAPQLPPPPPRDSGAGGGGCGPELTYQVERPLFEAEREREEWRQSNFAELANQRLEGVKNNADYFTEKIDGDIKRAQDRWHQADLQVNTYQTKKNQGTLANPELLAMALQERQDRWQELQHQKGRLDKVSTWRSQKTREIWSLRDRAKDGDYHGYRGLRDFDWSVHPNRFK
jgi:hypothetical protein